MNNTKCDYCGYKSKIADPGDTCPKCKKGIMCAKGSNGWN